MSEPAPTVSELRLRADRCDELAETAELMGDAPAADRYRALACEQRMLAMALLDD